MRILFEVNYQKFLSNPLTPEQGVVLIGVLQELQQVVSTGFGDNERFVEQNNSNLDIRIINDDDPRIETYDPSKAIQKLKIEISNLKKEIYDQKKSAPVSSSQEI